MSCVNYLNSYFYSHQNVIRYMALPLSDLPLDYVLYTSLVYAILGLVWILCFLGPLVALAFINNSSWILFLCSEGVVSNWHLGCAPDLLEVFFSGSS